MLKRLLLMMKVWTFRKEKGVQDESFWKEVKNCYYLAYYFRTCKVRNHLAKGLREARVLFKAKGD